MADAHSTIALNIGSQRIAMGIFEPSAKGGLILKKYAASSILADPAAEAARLPQIRVAVTELAEKLGVSKGSIKYALSGQSVFTRFVKLPPLEEDNIDQLVAFEAQQHVPFPIEEVVWDWQMLPGVEGDKEVVLVAIKGDSLNEVNDVIEEAGLHTEEVDASPMALFNALHYNYPDFDDATLLVDIGARTSNLIYMQGKRFFTRSVAAVSGSAITTAISKEYNIPFSEAETQKITNGLVALGSGHTSQMDEPTAALAMVIRNALSKLPSEISRTTNYYRSQHGGTAPKRILLAGSGANLPFTKDFLEEKVGVPVEFFNPLKKISVGSDVDVDVISKEAHAIGELIGLALRNVEGEAPVKIDLVPEAVQLERDNERRKPFLIAATVMALLGALLWSGTQFVRAAKAKSELETIQARVAVLQAPQNKIKRFQSQTDQVAKLGTQYSEVVKQRAQWLNLNKELNAIFADEAFWITDLSPVSGYDPLDTETGDQAKAKEVIAADFASDADYGTSKLLKVAAQKPKRGRGARNQKVAGINALQIKGYWLDNPRNDAVVYGLVKKLREGAENSLFDLTDPADRTGSKQLTDDQLIKSLSTTVVEGVYAAPFSIVLPLKDDLLLK